MGRHAVAVALPTAEYGPVEAELRAGGFDPIRVDNPGDLVAALRARRDIAVAILDGETDLDTSLEYYQILQDEGQAIPALMIMSSSALDTLTGAGRGHADDEYFTRPYSAEALRWRVEAMCIRLQAVDDGSGPILPAARIGDSDWGSRATVVAIFNPKGGVGKTTVATNLAAALAIRHHQRVLLVDADTVTGHVTMSLGLEQVRTVADSWVDQAEGGPIETLLDIAAVPSNGLHVVSLTSSPIHTEILDPERLAEAIGQARRSVDFIVVDLHPSYSAINQAIFKVADRILVPVTPDVPAIRAAIQLREVALEFGVRDRLAMIVNRANSGVSVEDMERTVGMPALALIRSGGMFFVRAANEGRTVIERFPKEKVSEDFDALAALLVPSAVRAVDRSGFRLFGRKEPARA